MFYNGPDVSVLCWHLRTASGCIYIVHRGWRSGPEHPAWEAGLEKMRTALDYVMLSSDSPSVTVLCLKLLSLFWSCSLSPDSRESVTIRWKNEFGEDWSFHVPLQWRGDRQKLKDSWQSQWLCLHLILYLDSLRLTNQHGGHWQFKRVGKSVLSGCAMCRGLNHSTASASHAPSQQKGPVQMRWIQDPDSDLPWTSSTVPFCSCGLSPLGLGGLLPALPWLLQ